MTDPRSDLGRASRVRPRRLRTTPALRALVAETRVSAAQLVMPHFVLGSRAAREPIAALPGIDRVGQDALLRDVEADLALGIRAVLLFGLVDDARKDARGRASAAARGPIATAVAALKRRFGAELVVITDVCLCAYTDHGHCGVLAGERIANDASLAPLSRMAVAHADAGADLVAPSDMMDGRVGALRDALDARGHVETGILSYAVKYASAYYGPFREAAHSAPAHGDRQSYQMDLRNVREALKEARLDAAEGADMLMVKPALAYLDVIRAVKQATELPLAAYNVSGEYAMVKAAAERGWIDEARVVRENLHALARAGADVLITYHARDALRGGWL
ncbi:MAG: porphobilinogen synthase [Planctomycetota bacterium]|nr:MAG: porphobilinogen synthase [Planctomycetota bacterium]